MQLRAVSDGVVLDTEGSPYLGFKEGLGSFHSLFGDVDLREAGEHAEAAVLSQLPCCRLPEDQQELRRRRRSRGSRM